MSRFRLGTLMLLISVAAIALPGTVCADSTRASQLYEDGVVRQRQGDLKGAVVQLKNALQQDTSLLPARMLLGTVYLQLGNGAAAQHELELATRLGADRMLTAVPFAQSLLLQSKYSELLERVQTDGFDRALESKLLVLRGHAQAELGNLTDAEQAFGRAARLDPDAAGPQVAQAMLLLRRGHPEQAQTLVDKALLLDGDSADVWSVKASIEHAMGNAEPALAAYAKVLALQPRNLDARIARAGLWIDTHHRAEAGKDIQFLKAEFPADPRAYYLDSLLLQQAGNAAGARDALQRASAALARIKPEELQRRAPLLLLAGLVHYSLGEYERAVEYLTSYIYRYPGQPGARKVLGAALLASGDHFRAIDVLEPALRAMPNDFRTMELLGLAYMRRGWHVQAAELLDRSAQMNAGSPGVRVDAALNRLAAGDEGAAAELEKVFDEHEEQSGAGILAALSYLRKGEPAQALGIARRLEQREPKNMTVLSLLASAQVGNGKLAEARTTLEGMLDRDPTFVPARLNLARLELMQGNADAARARLQDLLKDDSANAPAMVELARASADEGDQPTAVRWLEKARAAAPDYVPASVTLVDLHLRAGRAKEALAVAKEAAARLPDNLELVLALARSALAAGDNKQAKSVLSTRAYLAGFDGKWLYRIAQLQRAAGAPIEAVYSLQKAAKGDPDSLSVQIALADTLLSSDRLDEAAGVAATLLRRHPDAAAGDRIAGDIAFRRRQYAQALQHYRAAVAHEPSTALAIRIYNAERQLDRLKDGIAYLEQWLQRRPHDSAVRQALAEAYVRAGRHSDAEAEFRHLLREQPKNVSVMNNLAYLLLESEPGNARELATRAHGIAPDDASVNDTLGWILVRQGDARGGLTYLREAQYRDAANPEIRYHLAVALDALGRRDEARVELRQALASNDQFAAAPDARQLLERLDKGKNL